MIRKIEFDEIELFPKLSGKEFQKLRQYCGITQYELAKQAGGTSRSMACAWEKKLIVPPYQIKILKDMVELEIYLSALRLLNKFPLESNG
jgi:DNA-binding XRE family transcriptional regulator